MSLFLLGVDCLVIAYDMEVQPLAAHKYSLTFGVSAIGIDVVRILGYSINIMSAIGIDAMSGHKL